MLSCPKIVSFWPAGFVLVRWIESLSGLILAKSWAFLDASKELVLISKDIWKKWAKKPTLNSSFFCFVDCINLLVEELIV